jgi:hypothetical protein
MKNILLLVGILLAFSNLLCQEINKNEIIQKKSELTDFNANYPGTSFPRPFVTNGNPVENPKNSPAISTGYYFVHSNDPVIVPWRPIPNILDTTDDTKNWRRILSGPNQRTNNYWLSNLADGRRYFRNPNNMSDSCDNAIAGPIPIGFKFLFNGIEYDSFYVSTNGAIFLSNSRYYYDQYGNREFRNNNYGQPNCYNTMSMDWFERAKRSGSGLGDTTKDDLGWQKAVKYGCDSNYAKNARPDNNGGGMDIPLIAPFFGDGWLSQWDAVSKKVQDRGRVYFHRDSNNNKLIIYFVDFQIKGKLQHPFDSVYVWKPDSLQPWHNNYISTNAQIILNKSDTSITITYERFRGHIVKGLYEWTAKEVIRFNTSCVVSGPARHQNYNSRTGTGTYPWAEEYDQSTYVWSKYVTKVNTGYPENTQGIKFKQWKNTLRVSDISFRVKKQIENSEDFTEEISTSKVNNFEILAGHEQIGQLQPVIIVQNLSNDIQGPDGVNYQKQDLNFKVRCTIENQATKKIIYNKIFSLDSLILANKTSEDYFDKFYIAKASFDGKDYHIDTSHSDYYDANGKLKNFNGIPSYGHLAVFLPPFIPYEDNLSEIGLMSIIAYIEPVDPATNSKFGDMWQFDDTFKKDFWVLKQIQSNEVFNDDVTEYHVIPDKNQSPVAIPSVNKWVSIGATVIGGEYVSHNPLPPRGNIYCENSELFPNYKVSSPTIKLERPLSVVFGEWGGNELISFPIDMTNRNNPILSVAIQRATNRSSWDRGFSDEVLVGCEHRVVNSEWYNEVQKPDEILIQFKRPTLSDGKDGKLISNISEADWTYHPRRGGASAVTNMSAFTLFGGGGYMTGFLETDKDSALSLPVYTLPNRQLNGLRYDYYDDGIDNEFKTYFIPIPDSFYKRGNEFEKYFRFRIKLNAKNNQLSENTILDDDDAVYIDNIKLINSDLDIRLTKVEAKMPYTVIPASQVNRIPITFNIINYSNTYSSSFWVKTNIVYRSDFDQLYFPKESWVYRGHPDSLDDETIELFKQKNQEARDSARYILFHKKSVYCSSKLFSMLTPRANVELGTKNWNANNPPGGYIIISIIINQEADSDISYDTTFSGVSIRFGPMFAYHPIPNEGNQRMAENGVAQMSGRFGLGLNMNGYSMGGVGTNWSPIPNEYGDMGGDGGDGILATKFELTKEDTIFGIGGFFVSKGSSPDNIVYRLFSGDSLPETEIPLSVINSNRGTDALTGYYRLWDQIVYDLFDKPIVLPKGTYWATVEQLGEDGIELGASKSRVAMRCTKLHYHNPERPDSNGSKAIYLLLDKTLRKKNSNNNLVNDNLFAYKNGTDNWVAFAPETGNPGYGHLQHEGISPVDKQTKTYTRGTWIPYVLPYMGNKK